MYCPFGCYFDWASEFKLDTFNLLFATLIDEYELFPSKYFMKLLHIYIPMGYKYLVSSIFDYFWII